MATMPSSFKPSGFPTPGKPSKLPKLIVLEGPTGSGKTTFLSQFLERHKYQARWPAPDTGYVTTHFGKAPGKTPYAVAEWYLKILEELQGAPLIIDRWALSNVIYGHHLSNQVSLDAHLMKSLGDRVKFWYPSSHAMLICTAPVRVLLERNQGRNREAFLKTLGVVLKSYRASAKMGWLNPSLLDTSTLSPLETYYRGIDLLEKSIP